MLPADPLPLSLPKPPISREEWFIERLSGALITLRDLVELNPGVMGGMPVVKDTRFPLARVFAELADGLSVAEIADDYSVDEEVLKQIMDAFAGYFGKPTK